jgi:hypothetical protein
MVPFEQIFTQMSALGTIGSIALRQERSALESWFRSTLPDDTCD